MRVGHEMGFGCYSSTAGVANMVILKEDHITSVVIGTSEGDLSCQDVSKLVAIVIPALHQMVSEANCC